VTWDEITHILSVVVPLAGLIGFLDSRSRTYRRLVYERLQAHDDSVARHHATNIDHINKLDVRLAWLEAQLDIRERRATPRVQ